VRRFEQLIERSEFRFDYSETIPIRRAKALFSPLTREFLTSVVRCKLVPR
jgi:hypothetical protein